MMRMMMKRRIITIGIRIRSWSSSSRPTVDVVDVTVAKLVAVVLPMVGARQTIPLSSQHRIFLLLLLLLLLNLCLLEQSPGNVAIIQGTRRRRSSGSTSGGGGDLRKLLLMRLLLLSKTKKTVESRYCHGVVMRRSEA